MSRDRETLSVYDAQARHYAEAYDSDRPDATLQAFIDDLGAGAAVLDLGCGTGAASAHMAAAGLAPDPVDASAAMVDEARAKGLPARQASFEEIDGEDLYDGIWANFSLLHAPRGDLPGHLNRLRRALKPGGQLHLGMKTGAGEERDRLGRFYCYYAPDELARLLDAAGFTVADSREGAEYGLAGTLDGFVLIRAHG